MKIFLKIIAGIILNGCLIVNSYAYASANRVTNFSDKPWTLRAMPLVGPDHIGGSVEFNNCGKINGPCVIQPYSSIYIWYKGDKTGLVVGQMKITDYKNMSMYFAFDNYNDGIMEIEPKNTDGVIDSNMSNMGDIFIGASSYDND